MFMYTHKKEILDKVYATSAYVVLEKDLNKKKGYELSQSFRTNVEKILDFYLESYSNETITEDKNFILREVIQKLPSLHHLINDKKGLKFFLENL